MSFDVTRLRTVARYEVYANVPGSDSGKRLSFDDVALVKTDEHFLKLLPLADDAAPIAVFRAERVIYIRRLGD